MDQHIDPTPEQFQAFKDLPRNHPIEMLNLVRLRDLAAYPKDHPLHGQRVTGAEAYQTYGTQSAPILERLGGRILWRGQFETTLIGPQDAIWHVSFIARYPDAAAFLQMVTDPDYQKAVVHRQAAVHTSRLIRHGSAAAGTRFQ